MKIIFLTFGMIVMTVGCSSKFIVKSEPQQAEVFVATGTSDKVEKKSIGKTPIEIPLSQINETVGKDVTSGEFFTVSVEKEGFVTQSFSIPSTRFGTLVTNLDVKMVKGKTEEEAKTAKAIINHLFLAQKFALSQQYERAHIELDKILADHPGFARALSMRASIYFAQKKLDDSIKWYEEALKSEPQMEDAVKMLAKVRLLQSGRSPAAAPPGASGKGGAP